MPRTWARTVRRSTGAASWVVLTLAVLAGACSDSAGGGAIDGSAIAVVDCPDDEVPGTACLRLTARTDGPAFGSATGSCAIHPWGPDVRSDAVATVADVALEDGGSVDVELQVAPEDVPPDPDWYAFCQPGPEG